MKTVPRPGETATGGVVETGVATDQGVGPVSVVIPCRDEATHIETLLEAVRRQDVRADEIIVVDTGSRDGTPEILKGYAERHPDFPLRVVSCSEPGVAAAVNAGIEVARGEAIVRLDGHSCPRLDYLRKAVEALRATKAGVVGGVWQIVPGGSSRVAEAIAGAVAHPIGAGDAVYRTARTTENRMQVDTVPFGCFRKSTWEKLGGLNEALLTNEDYDFNCRVRASGSTVVLDPDIRCDYFARRSLSELARQYFRYGWWKGQMLKKHPRSLRWRQAVPGALVPTFAILASMSLVAPVALLLLGGLAAAYVATLTGAAAQIAREERRWGLWGPLVAAFGVVHFAWSSGFAVNLVTASRWPAWNERQRGAGPDGQRGFTGATLLGTLLAILVLALVVPPGLATLLNGSRIDRAQEQVRVLAQEVRAAASAPDGDIQQAADAWIGVERYVSEGFSPDPWGNQYLVNIGLLKETAPAGSGDASAVWVLSAGPNSIVDTAYRLPARSASVGGDDIGARVR